MDENKKDRVEAEGSTIEEAIQKGLKELGVTRDKVVVKVVSEEQKGLFGMEGAKPAKVVVALKDEEKP